ncbi:MAG: hypothetical protein M3198_20460 [Actinomycetota bacterium]|nr:hypothetical protein [Actinomycetota bacterium]
MHDSYKTLRRSTWTVCLACVLLIVGTLFSSSASAAHGVDLAYHDGDRWVTATANGEVVRRFRPFWSTTFDGRLFAAHVKNPAGDVVDRVIGFGPRNGERRFVIENASLPVAVKNGEKLAFLPDTEGERDRQGNSVWMRKQGGRIHKIVQFSNGGNLPGVETGFDGGAGVLEYAFDRRGSRLVVTEGNDFDTFEYDIWLVKVRSGAARRMTTGERSRFPSLSPNGRRLAYVRENAHCGGPFPGYRSGTLKITPTRGRPRPRNLIEGTCDRYFTEPRWVGRRSLVAVRMVRASPGHYDRDLVKINVVSKTTETLVDSSDVIWFSASPARKLIAFGRRGHRRVFVYDMRTGVRRRIPGSEAAIGARVRGDHRL